MWQVVTSSQTTETLAEQSLCDADLDALLTALTALQPQLPPTHKLLPFKPKSDPVHAPRRDRLHAASTPATAEVIDLLDIPRPTNVPVAPPVPADLRASLQKLRATIMLAAELQGLRTVLLCEAESDGNNDSNAELAAQLSQTLAEYERLKVAHLEVRDAASEAVLRRKVLPIGYTFQIRRTRRANLYEIASSLGVVRLDDWLRWWQPRVVLQEMKKMFDLTIIYAPAITANPDVALLAAAVDGVILLATENVTSYASVATATQQLRAAQARILGVTLQQPAAAPAPFAGVKNRVREFIETLARSK